MKTLCSLAKYLLVKLFITLPFRVKGLWVRPKVRIMLEVPYWNKDILSFLDGDIIVGDFFVANTL